MLGDRMGNTEKPSQERKKALFKLEIEVRLHGKLREEEWEDLITDHNVEKLLDGTLSCSAVAEKVRRRRQIYGQSEMSQDSAARTTWGCRHFVRRCLVASVYPRIRSPIGSRRRPGKMNRPRGG